MRKPPPPGVNARTRWEDVTEDFVVCIGEPNHKLTLASVVYEGGHEVIGNALRHDEDAWTPRIGRLLSLGRALKGLGDDLIKEANALVQVEASKRNALIDPERVEVVIRKGGKDRRTLLVKGSVGGPQGPRIGMGSHTVAREVEYQLDEFARGGDSEWQRRTQPSEGLSTSSPTPETTRRPS